MDDSAERPSISGLHHLAVTVRDVEASAAWYQRVLGLQRLPAPFPHHGDVSPGYGVLLVDAGGWAIGLHHHDRSRPDVADETRTGLDHLGIAVPERADLDRWAARLDRLGVPHGGVTDVAEPVPYAALVFRDPDNVQLELVHLPG